MRALVDLCGRKNIKIECGKSEAVYSSEEIEDEVGNKEEATDEKSEESPSDEELEVTEEEKRRLAKGKAVAVSEPSNKEKQGLTKGKEVAVFETSDEEPQRQPPKLKLGGEKKKSDKDEQEIVAGVATTIKVGIGMGKVKLDIVNEPEKLMNFDLKWVIDVPSLEDGEPQTALSETLNASVQIPPITVQGEGSGNTTNKVGCVNCTNCSIV